MTMNIQRGSKMIVTNDILVNDAVVFGKGEQVVVESVSPDPGQPECCYVVTSAKTNRQYTLSAKDIVELPKDASATASPPNTNKKSPRKKWVWIAVTAAVVVIAVVVVVVLLATGGQATVVGHTYYTTYKSNGGRNTITFNKDMAVDADGNHYSYNIEKSGKGYEITLHIQGKTGDLAKLYELTWSPMFVSGDCKTLVTPNQDITTTDPQVYHLER